MTEDNQALRASVGLPAMGSNIDPRVVRKTIAEAVQKEYNARAPPLRILDILERQCNREDVLRCGEQYVLPSLIALLLGSLSLRSFVSDRASRVRHVRHTAQNTGFLDVS
jgi:hypothetical protein